MCKNQVLAGQSSPPRLLCLKRALGVYKQNKSKRMTYNQWINFYDETLK